MKYAVWKNLVSYLLAGLIIACILGSTTRSQEVEYTLESAFSRLYNWAFYANKYSKDRRETTWNALLESMQGTVILVEYLPVDANNVHTNEDRTEFEFVYKTYIDKLQEKLHFEDCYKCEERFGGYYIASAPHSLEIILRDTDDKLAKELIGVTPVGVIGWIRKVEAGKAIRIEIDIITWWKI